MVWLGDDGDVRMWEAEYRLWEESSWLLTKGTSVSGMRLASMQTKSSKSEMLLKMIGS